jgi:hypothetical protein
MAENRPKTIQAPGSGDGELAICDSETWCLDVVTNIGRQMLVEVKAGKKIPGREFESEDITVMNCIFLHGHGMSIGSETVGGARNVTVKNCTFENTENGIRIKSDVTRGGLVENINYSDITMSNVAPAITFTC